MNVFISHKTANKALLNNIVECITKWGHTPKYAEWETAPCEIQQKIKELIDESDFFLLLFTKEASESQFVNQEIGYACKSNLPMLILKDEDVKLEGFIHSHDFTILKNEEEYLPRIHKAIDNNEKKVKKVEETKEDVVATLISTRGFYARLYESGINTWDMKMYLGKKLPTEKKLAENGGYYQEYEVHYNCNEYNGCIVLDIKFNKNNEIIGCKQRTFECPKSTKKGDVAEYEFFKAIE